MKRKERKEMTKAEKRTTDQCHETTTPEQGHPCTLPSRLLATRDGRGCGASDQLPVQARAQSPFGLGHSCRQGHPSDHAPVRRRAQSVEPKPVPPSRRWRKGDFQGCFFLSPTCSETTTVQSVLVLAQCYTSASAAAAVDSPAKTSNKERVSPDASKQCDSPPSQ
jgi:hypothetical protein